MDFGLEERWAEEYQSEIREKVRWAGVRGEVRADKCLTEAGLEECWAEVRAEVRTEECRAQVWAEEVFVEFQMVFWAQRSRRRQRLA